MLAVCADIKNHSRRNKLKQQTFVDSFRLQADGISHFQQWDCFIAAALMGGSDLAADMRERGQRRCCNAQGHQEAGCCLLWVSS